MTTDHLAARAATPPPRWRRRALAASTALLLAATAACSFGEPSDVAGGAAAAPGPGRDKVTYLTGFGAFGREGYAWVALSKGYFAQAGIDVTIQPGAAGDSNLTLLKGGKAQFAAIDYAGAAQRAGRGKFAGYRLVGAVNQQTLIAMMAIAGGAITVPKDLAGKRIGVAAGAVPETMFPAYARLAGIDARTIRWVRVHPPQLPALLASHQVDAIGQFTVGKPAIDKAVQGPKPGSAAPSVLVMPYSDLMRDLYGNVIVTTDEVLRGNPDLAQRFVKALIQGLRYSVEHPSEAGDIVHRYVPATNADVARQELELMGTTVQSATGFGAFDRIRVVRSIALLQSVGSIPTVISPESFVDFSIVPTGGVR